MLGTMFTSAYSFHGFTCLKLTACRVCYAVHFTDEETVILKELSYLPKVKRIVHVTEEVFESVNEKSAIGKKKKKRVGGKLMEFSRILKFY